MGWKEIYRTKDFKANGKVLWVFSKGTTGKPLPSSERHPSQASASSFPSAFYSSFFFFLPDFLNWGEIPKESDTTEWLNWTVLNSLTQKNYCFKPFLSVHLSGIKYTHIVAYPSPPSISRTFLSSQTEPVPLNTDCPSPYSPRLWSPLFYLSILGYSRYLT